MDWPGSFGHPPMVAGGVLSRDSVLQALDVAASSIAWPTANTAVFVPFHVYTPTVVKQIGWFNGSAVSGNVDCGIYDAAGTRLISTGSTAQAGVSTIQTVDVTDTLLGPGLFYMAFAADNITATVIGIVPTLQRGRVLGLVEMATAFALPATATFATLTGNVVPFACFTTRSLI